MFYVLTVSLICLIIFNVRRQAKRRIATGKFCHLKYLIMTRSYRHTLQFIEKESIDSKYNEDIVFADFVQNQKPESFKDRYRETVTEIFVIKDTLSRSPLTKDTVAIDADLEKALGELTAVYNELRMLYPRVDF